MAEVARLDGRDGELLAVARALVVPDAYAAVEGTLGATLGVRTLGPAAIEVLCDILGKGIVKTLARLGGARPRPRPGAEAGRAVRVFEVRPPPKIAFGPYTFELLRWLTNTPLRPRADVPSFERTAETLGDELAAYLALRLVEGRRIADVVARQPGLRTSLAWLGFARPLARSADVGDELPSFDALLASEDARTVVECLGADLARRWAATAEWDGHDAMTVAQAVRIGTRERAVLARFLDAAGAAGRWDLATFLVDAAAAVLPRGALARDVARRAAPPLRAEDASLRERSEARRRSGALFHALGRIARRRDELALVRFIDDGYEGAQAVLSAWERLPRDAFARAEQVASALDALELA